VNIVDLANLGSLGLKIQGNEPFKQLGFRVTGAGDVNQDGIDDFIMSAMYTNDGYAPGGAYVIFGKEGGLGAIDLDTLDPSEGFFAQAPADGHLTSETLSAAGDFNGDGFDDVLIGSPRDFNYAGRSYVVFGKADGFGTLDLDTLAATDGFAITNNVSQQWAGSGLSSAGDINHDGYDDIIVGTVANRAYVIFGKASGFDTIELNAFDPADGFIIEGDGANDMAGGGSTGVGDFNGDGIDDFVIGAVSANKAYIIFGKEAAWTDLDLGNFSAADGIVITQGSSADSFGYNMAAAGDINGDGFEDLLLGTNNGKAYVIFGRASGSAALELSNLGSAGFLIQGDPQTSFGSAVGAAGDVNGDGFDDIVVGALGDSRGEHYAGGAYVIYGKASGFSTIDVATLGDAEGFFIQGENDTDLAGGRFKEAADVNGDGFSDVLIGSSRNGEGGLYAGAAYIVYGIVPTAGLVRVGTVAGQILAGGTGNDMLDGREGDDRLFGNGGNDSLDGGLGADEMRGGAGDDVYWVDDAGDTVVERPNQGNDEVRTTLATYSLLGSEVENLTAASNLVHDFRGSAANNVVTGGNAGDVLRLQDGGEDTALGGPGNDLLYFGAALSAGDVADGGAGRDAVVLQGNVTIVLNDANLVGIESLSLQSGANAFFGDTANNFYDFDITMADGNVLAGQQLIVNAQSLRAGEDFTFDGSAEHDGKFLVFGGRGVDHLTGGDGNDIFFFEGDRWGAGDRIDGGAGRDALVISAGNSTTHIDFGPTSLVGIESISVSNQYSSIPTATPDYEFVLDNGNVAAGQTLIVNGATLADPSQTISVDGSAVHLGKLTLIGGAGGDSLSGGSGADQLQGQSGADTLSGNGGNDRLEGGDGDDVIAGGSGADQLVGGLGNDLYTMDTSDTIVEAANAGTDEVRTVLAAYTLGANLENLTGTSSAGQSLTGNGLANRLTGGAGNDVLDGSAGNDTLKGGGGTDLLIGGTGADSLNGGAGADTFRYDAATDSTASRTDLIGDFKVGVDKIDLSAIDANTLTGGDQAFSWIGGNAFSGAGAASAGELRTYQSGSHWWVEGDTNGDGTADLVIALTPQPGMPLGQGDFLL
jgi:Ca2+-binding RTX toxin-like protein